MLLFQRIDTSELNGNKSFGKVIRKRKRPERRNIESEFTVSAGNLSLRKNLQE